MNKTVCNILSNKKSCFVISKEMLFFVFTILCLFSATVSSEAKQPNGNTRTKAEIATLIEKQGKTPPDWWDSVQLNYPPTLDLNWPMKTSEQWNNQKNVGCYIWDIINPNPDKWKEGVKLVHHVLVLHKDDPAKVKRDMNDLGRMYHDLLGDWARAAFWWKKGGGNPLGLAHCYWKLGNKDMTIEILKRFGPDYTRFSSIIRLWGEIGEYDKAIKLAEAKANAGIPDSAYLAAGDICRLAKWYDRSIIYYKKVLNVPGVGKQKDAIDRSKARARANMEAVKLFDALDLSRIPDGTYQSNTIAYNGQLYVEIRVANRKIESIKVTRHNEKQFYSSISDTVRQIIENQSLKGIDATSGATITSEAIINATAKALANAMK